MPLTGRQMWTCTFKFMTTNQEIRFCNYEREFLSRSMITFNVFHDLPQDSVFIPISHVMFSEITKNPTVCMVHTASDCFQVIAL